MGTLANQNPRQELCGRISSVLIALLWLALPQSQAAQTEREPVCLGSIHVSVTDPVGAVVFRAQVQVRSLESQGSGSPITRTGVTDDTGSFTANGLPDGKYEVSVSADGFGHRKLNITLIRAGSRRASIVMGVPCPSNNNVTRTLTDEERFEITRRIVEMAGLNVSNKPLSARNIPPRVRARLEKLGVRFLAPDFHTRHPREEATSFFEITRFEAVDSCVRVWLVGYCLTKGVVENLCGEDIVFEFICTGGECNGQIVLRTIG